ncbi:PREDICTED: uncharacterized protein LOC106887620 [Calidris pugnax]|uniref:uncharacterized protein LOC106887620 n=1 Tax=Calidris pugnax TaxID=198806 RepID=UPI00071E1056|nr:PREDICTED: uncharacterized protein LOC106887620 [Calidris pugnax]
MEHGLTAGGRKEHALPRARGATAGVLGHIRQHLEEGAPGLMEPELLLDLPLGVKIPVPRSSRPVFCRAKLGEKLQRPSGFYDLGDPYNRLLRVEYNSLHDPYLQEYHCRRDNFERLRKHGLITSNGGVVSTLKEFNDYRQYLTRLKLQAEQVYRQEEEKLQQRLARLKEAHKPLGAFSTSCPAERLLQPRRPACPPPPKSRMTAKCGRCGRVMADLALSGQSCSPSQPGQEGAELPRRVSAGGGSKTSSASTLTRRTTARSVLDSVVEEIRRPGAALTPKPQGGKRATNAPTPPEEEGSSPTQNTFPSTGPQSSLRPVPPAGPKPPAQTGARRRVVRIKPVEGKAQQPAADVRKEAEKLVDDVLRRWAASDV